MAAALSGALAIAAGAFGAHAAGERAAELLRTGGLYQLIHAVAALVAGSLYALALGGPRWLGPVTPIGGLAMIGGWLWLAWSLRAM
jgi:uncharacterized membrane protein YgdD (TMEM256/DUF423 family)